MVLRPRVNITTENRVDYMIRTSVDGLAASTRAGPITGLDEEVWDDPVSSHGKSINFWLFNDRGSTPFQVSRQKKMGYLPVEYDSVIVALV